MISDKTSLFNLALDAVGTRSDVSHPDEESREAEICRLWFAPVRDLVLRAAPWNSAKAFARLAVLAERNDTLAWVPTDPEPGFRFAYAAPSDIIAPRYLSTFERFTYGVYQGVRSISAQAEQSILVYTRREENISLWDDQLAMAITHALAAHIAMPLHAKAARARQAQEEANSLITNARVNDANANINEFDTIPDWLAARGYAGNAPNTRFYYPYGPMISVTEAVGVR